MTKTKLEHAWDCYSAADNLYAQRFAYLVVAQAMLVAGYSTLHASGQDYSLQRAITLLGMVLAVIQLVVSWSLDRKMRNLLPTLKTDEVYLSYLGEKKSELVTNLQTFFTPMAVGVFWLFAFYRSCRVCELKVKSLFPLMGLQ
jgi:hypothetical protein